MNPNPEYHSIRRIVLASGRSLEVVRFFPDEHRLPGLDICPECASSFVQPIEWNEAPRGYWQLTLHCPNCDWLNAGVFDQDEVDSLEEKLDAGLSEMLCDLRRLTQSNMTEEIERFATALHADFILPEDF